MCLAVVFLFCLTLQEGKSKLQAWIEASIFWILYCFILNEGLSLFSAISRGSLFAAWMILDLVLLGCIWKKYQLRFNNLGQKIQVGREKWKESYFGRYPKLALVWSLVALGMIFVALYTIPSNYDSETYHLARIYHWAQNGSIAHYATNIERQDASPVLAEFINLHVYLLSGSGKGVMNLLQCICFLTNGVVVFGIARKLKLSKGSSVLSAMLFYACPIAMAEAMTTQVDELSTYLCLAFVYLLLDFLKPEEKISFDLATVGKVLTMSLCVAFGYLAKPSILFAVLIFGLWLCFVMIRRKDSPKVFGYAAIAVVAMAIILLPEWMRNLQTFDAIASSKTGARQLVGTLNPKWLLVSFLMNLSFNLPTTLIHQSNFYINAIVRGIASVLGVDLTSPMITEDGGGYSVTMAPNYGCDTAISPNIVWGALLGIVVVAICFRKIKKEKLKLGYFVAAILSFFFLCVFVMFERFVGRYMITYLALLCPAIGIALDLVRTRVSNNAFEALRGGRLSPVRHGIF